MANFRSKLSNVYTAVMTKKNVTVLRHWSDFFGCSRPSLPWICNEICQATTTLVQGRLGTVHKLCRLSRVGVKNCRFHTVKRRLRGGRRGSKSPILRQNSLWTAPYLLWGRSIISLTKPKWLCDNWWFVHQIVTEIIWCIKCLNQWKSIMSNEYFWLQWELKISRFVQLHIFQNQVWT